MKVLSIVLACSLTPCISGVLVAYTWASNPSIGEGYTGAYKGKIVRFGTTPESSFPPDRKFCVPPCWEVELEGARASGDKDTRNTGDPCNPDPTLFSDALKEGWPRWQASTGSFKDSVTYGITVVWVAPENETWDITIYLFENDIPAVVTPPDTGTRDDGGTGGINQSQVKVDTIPLEVTLFIRNDKNCTGTEQTTNSTPNGPDSRGMLGLWLGKDGKEDWKQACADFQNGSIYNGGAPYLMDDHPRKTGTGLKTEIYAKIDKTRYLNNPAVLSEINANVNWRFGQECNGYLTYRVFTNGAWGDPQDFDSEHKPPDWYADGPRYFGWGDSRTTIQLDDNPINYIYYGDAPCLKRSEVTFTVIMIMVPGEDDDHLKLNVDDNFRTWVEWRYLGKWGKITHVPDAVEPKWPKGEPMWGYTAEIEQNWDEEEEDWVLTINQQAKAKTSF